MMIRVHYKPLDALRPMHLALLASLNPPTSRLKVASNLSVPEMILDHAVDDAVAWSLVAQTGDALALTERGNRCVAVWAATDKRGFWEFEDGSGWLLGKGLFSFRKPLKSLDAAGLDAETGNLLAECDAKDRLKKYQRANLQLDVEIKQEALRHCLIQTFRDAKELAPVIEQALTQAKTRLQLNQLIRLAECALVELQQAGTDQLLADRRNAIGDANKMIKRLRHEVQWQIRDHESATQDLTRVLLAAWLAQQKGFLKEIAESEPDSLLVRSEFGDFSWMDERPIPEVEPNYQSPSSPASTSFVDRVGEFIGSFFR